MNKKNRIQNKARNYTPKEVRDFLLALHYISAITFMRAVKKEDVSVIQEGFRLLDENILKPKLQVTQEQS